MFTFEFTLNYNPGSKSEKAELLKLIDQKEPAQHDSGDTIDVFSCRAFEIGELPVLWVEDYLHILALFILELLGICRNSARKREFFAFISKVEHGILGSPLILKTD